MQAATRPEAQIADVEAEAAPVFTDPWCEITRFLRSMALCGELP
ncbi:hypothetical protein [Antrihabitans stalagmiti]|nr:hypothetical protein [Antrihabitans stalagmiti]